jgi:hypothetical protein
VGRADLLIAGAEDEGNARPGQRSPSLSSALTTKLDERAAAILARGASVCLTTTVALAGHTISVDCDDRAFFRDFFWMFGGPEPRTGHADPAASLAVSITGGGVDGYGHFRITGRHARPLDGAEFAFTVAAEDGHFQQLDGYADGWTCLAFRGDDEPMFAFRDTECLFQLGPGWRSAVILFLLYHLLRLRDDAIFFHAAAVGIGGEGTIFIGPKEAGKSTTALALAARGHTLLSDEFAGYVPASGEVIPFLRPIGIRPGPRAARVTASLGDSRRQEIDDRGFVRVGVDTLFPVPPARPFPLRRVVYLAPFEAQPRLERIEPGRHEVAMAQPILSSFINSPHRRRVFEVVRMLASARVYRLHPGQPDATAIHLEERFANE